MWKLELTSNGVSLGNAEIRRGISQGDSLSSLFCATYGSIIIDFKIPVSLSLSLMKAIDEERYKFLGMLHGNGICKKKRRKIRFNLISKLNGKNKIKAINS